MVKACVLKQGAAIAFVSRKKRQCLFWELGAVFPKASIILRCFTIVVNNIGWH